MLARDEPLSLVDIIDAQLNARLAVLSACESALAGGVVDEVVALPTGLLHAGAAGSIASMWSVSDAAAAVVMTCFYAEWLDAEHPPAQALPDSERPPAQALRTAQRWVRDTTDDEKATRFPELADVLSGPGRRYAHPADWAAFALFGV